MAITLSNLNFKGWDLLESILQEKIHLEWYISCLFLPRIKGKKSFSNFSLPFFNTCFWPYFFVSAKSFYPYNFLIRARRKNPRVPLNYPSQNTPTMIYLNPWNKFLRKWRKFFVFGYDRFTKIRFLAITLSNLNFKGSDLLESILQEEIHLQWYISCLFLSRIKRKKSVSFFIAIFQHVVLTLFFR